MGLCKRTARFAGWYPPFCFSGLLHTHASCFCDSDDSSTDEGASGNYQDGCVISGGSKFCLPYLHTQFLLEQVPAFLQLHDPANLPT